MFLSLLQTCHFLIIPSQLQPGELPGLPFLFSIFSDTQPQDDSDALLLPTHPYFIGSLRFTIPILHYSSLSAGSACDLTFMLYQTLLFSSFSRSCMADY